MRAHVLIGFAAAGIVSLAAGLAHADCVDPRTCLCAPSGATDGIYWGEVEGGNQVRITEIVVGSNDGVDPTIYVVPGVDEPVGTEVLVSSNGHLVATADGRTVSCPAGTYGSTLTVSRADASRLAGSVDCFGELDRVTIGGDFPPCDDTGFGGGSLACSAAGPAQGGGLAALLGLALLGQRRRRSSASMYRA